MANLPQLSFAELSRTKTPAVLGQMEPCKKSLGDGHPSSVTLHESHADLDLSNLPIGEKSKPPPLVTKNLGKQKSFFGDRLENDDGDDYLAEKTIIVDSAYAKSPDTPIASVMTSDKRISASTLFKTAIDKNSLSREANDCGMQKIGDFIQFTTSTCPEPEAMPSLEPRMPAIIMSKPLSLSISQGPSHSSFDANFQLGAILGQGGNSTVRCGTERKNGRSVVCKFIRDSSVWHWHVDPVTNMRIPLEVHLMQQITSLYPNCPYFVRYIEHFDTRGTPRPGLIGGGLANSMTAAEKFYEESISRNPLAQLARKVRASSPSVATSKQEMPRHAIVMEQTLPENSWIDLYDYVEIYGPVNESATKTIFSRVLASVLMLHQLGVSHNDIKDENVLINRQTLEIKLLDLGSATWLPQKTRVNSQQIRVPQLATQFYGTKKFAAPECVQGLPYRTEVQEVWALGALLFVMLYKADPFKDNREICAIDISYKVAKHAARGIHISKQAEAALSAMLHKDPRQRIHIHDIPQLDWFRGVF